MIFLVVVAALVSLALANDLSKRAVLPDGLPTNPVKNHAWTNSKDSYVAFDGGLTERLGARGFTIEAWVYNEDPAANFQPIVAHADKDAADIFHVDFLLQTNANNGRVTFVMGAGPDTYGFQLQGATLPFNVWTHVAVTVAADNSGTPTAARLYMNGNLVAQDDTWGGGAGSRQVTDEPITMGYVNLGGQEMHWLGSIDELRFWDSVRTQAALVRDHRDPFLFSDPVEIPLNLVGYYSFDAGPETAVWDNSRQPYFDGLPINGQAREETSDDVVDVPLSPLLAPIAGPESYGLAFTGAHEAQNSVELPSSLSRALPRGFTFEAWVYLEAPPLVDQHYKTIVSRYSSSAAANHQSGTFEAGSNPESDFVFQVDPRNGRLAFFMGGGRGQCERTSLGYGVALFSSGEYNLKAYEWTHVAFSVFATETQEDPFMAKMYVNGREVPQAAELPGNAWRAECHRNFLFAEPIHLGFYSNGIDQYWEGRIDEVRFWSEPREDAAIQADYIRPLQGNEPNLLAYYQLDEGESTRIIDASPHRHDALAMTPEWVLSQGPTEVVDGVSGFPVHVTLQGRSPFNNGDEFEYVITELPTNGGLFTTGAPIELLEQADVDNARRIDQMITFVSNIGFSGYDTFGYAAISKDTGMQSETHFVAVKVAPYEVPENAAPLDACGVPGGDGMSCVGGCDGKGGEIDECGVCAGEGASCTCVFYKTFHTNELDCVLFENQVNRTMARIENSVKTLHRALMALETFDQNTWRNGFYDLGVPLEFLCSFLNGCLPPWEESLTEFEETIAGELSLCEPLPFE